MAAIGFPIGRTVSRDDIARQTDGPPSELSAKSARPLDSARPDSSEKSENPRRPAQRPQFAAAVLECGGFSTAFSFPHDPETEA
jgi:hypothetical protein